MAYDEIAVSRHVSSKPRNIKQHNQRLLVGLLQHHAFMTATELSELAGLSKTTVTKIVGDLVGHGIVKSLGKGDSTEEGGKKPELYALNEQFKYVFSIGWGTPPIKCMITDLRGTPVYYDTKAFRNLDDYESCVQDLADAICGMMDSAGLSPEEICAIVLSCEGIVDAESGTIQYPVHNKSWGRDLGVREDLQKRLDFPARIFVDNGCRFSGYAELLHHPEYTSQRVAVIFTASATGGCLMENGTLMKGTNGFVGELGHIVVKPDFSVKCTCGNFGCFETLVSQEALVEYALEESRRHPESPLSPLAQKGQLDYVEIFVQADQGDALARDVLDRVIRYFTIVIQDIILLFDPHTIVLQGIYTGAGEYFLKSLRERVNTYPFYKIKRNLEVVYSGFDGQVVIQLGGAIYAIDTLFNEGEMLP